MAIQDQIYATTNVLSDEFVQNLITQHDKGDIELLISLNCLDDEKLKALLLLLSNNPKELAIRSKCLTILLQRTRRAVYHTALQNRRLL